MFTRLRNLFSKPKAEKSPEPERKLENAKNVQVNNKNNVEERTSEFENTLHENNQKKCSEENENKFSSGLAVKLEHPQLNNKPNEFQNFLSITEGSICMESNSNLLHSQNRNNKLDKSINKTKNYSATYSKINNATNEVVVVTEYRNEGHEPISVDKVLNKACTQLNDYSLKQIENQKLLGVEEDQDKINPIGSDKFEHFDSSDSNHDKTPTNTNIETLVETLMSANDKSNEISYSISVDDLATDVPNPAGDTLTQFSTSPDGTTASDGTVESGTIVIKPSGNNSIACAAISNKMQEIAEVAESLDVAIRDVQQDAEAFESNLESGAEKKREAMTLRSNSSEDWQSRSTEDESFVTASEFNFTPQSNSSSYQTASGRTSSFISSGKNSFDLNETDNSTFVSAYDIPADINMSFDGSEQSFISEQPQEDMASVKQQQQQPILSFEQQDTHQQKHENTEDQYVDGAYALPSTINEDNANIDAIIELHSQSVTPTPGDGNIEQYNLESIPVETVESDLDSSCIVDSPSMEMLTEEEVPVTSMTSEVSTCSYIQHEQTQQPTKTTNNNSNNNNNNTNNQKPNAAWRRSKYYENITKQTIKGFL